MKKHIVLLRGINVSGKNRIPMADLRDLLNDLSFKNVQTFIQSGNIILESDEGKSGICTKINKGIQDTFGYDVPVMARTIPEWKKAIENYPFSLENEKETLAGDLSHGKKQWLDIALATLSKPDLVFLDEPTAGLSFDETEKTGNIIKKLNKQGITFVIVGHDMDFVKQIASRVSVLHLGKIFFEGSVAEVLSDKDVNNIYLGVS